MTPTVLGAKPLVGLRVLDMSKVLAGPLCTQHLADFGADVIKVEAPGVGDETRRWPPYQAETGAVFLSVNRNKRSIALDLKTSAGREIVGRLAERADIALESFAPGVAAKLGVDHATLRLRNPRLIYCSISGYGQTGPLASQPGYDLVLQAFGGLLSLTGEVGGGPVRSPMSPIDQATGMNALSGILAAAFRRERTGEGAYLEVSLFESAMGLLGYILQSYWVSGKSPGKSGSGHPSLCPYQVFETSDRPILIGVPSDNLWRRFCKAAGVEELGTDPRFATNAARVDNAVETIATVQALVAQRSCDEWVALLIEAGLPGAPLNDLAALLAHPQTQARQIVQPYHDPHRGPSRAVAQPISFAGIERTPGTAPPLLGEHSAGILSELGYSKDAIAGFRTENSVRFQEPMA